MPDEGEPGEGGRLDEARPEADRTLIEAIATELEQIRALKTAGIRPLGWELGGLRPAFHFQSEYGPHRIVITLKDWRRLPASAVALSVAQDVLIQLESRRRNHQ